MKIISQLAIICGVFWLSQLIEVLLPFSFPASVIGILLMLLLLMVKGIKEKQIREVSDFFTGNMGLFFLPAAVSILNYVDAILKNAVAFLTVCVVSMLLTFWVTGMTVHLMRKWMKQEESA